MPCDGAAGRSGSRELREASVSERNLRKRAAQPGLVQGFAGPLDARRPKAHGRWAIGWGTVRAGRRDAGAVGGCGSCRVEPVPGGPAAQAGREGGAGEGRQARPRAESNRGRRQLKPPTPVPRFAFNVYACWFVYIPNNSLCEPVRTAVRTNSVFSTRYTSSQSGSMWHSR